MSVFLSAQRAAAAACVDYEMTRLRWWMWGARMASMHVHVRAFEDLN